MYCVLPLPLLYVRLYTACLSCQVTYSSSTPMFTLQTGCTAAVPGGMLPLAHATRTLVHDICCCLLVEYREIPKAEISWLFGRQVTAAVDQKCSLRSYICSRYEYLVPSMLQHTRGRSIALSYPPSKGGVLPQPTLSRTPNPTKPYPNTEHKKSVVTRLPLQMASPPFFSDILIFCLSQQQCLHICNL